jgi:hypothetical protein
MIKGLRVLIQLALAMGESAVIHFIIHYSAINLVNHKAINFIIKIVFLPLSIKWCMTSSSSLA